jgi:hypothetical protein
MLAPMAFPAVKMAGSIMQGIPPVALKTQAG